MILRLLSLVVSLAISINCLGIVTFSQQFKEHLATLQPIQIQPMKEESIPDTNELLELPPHKKRKLTYALPNLVPDGTPIIITIEQLEKLGSKYLTNLLEELDKPEIIPVASDRETFQLLLTAAEAYPKTPIINPSKETVEKLLLVSDLLNIDQKIMLSILRTFSSQDLCTLYSIHSHNEHIAQILKKAVWPRLKWNIREVFENSSFPLSVAMSSDGKYMVGGYKDGTVKIWNMVNGQLINTLGTIHDEEDIDALIKIYAVALSHDNKYIISGSQDSTIKIWDFTTGKLIRTIGATDNNDPNVGHLGWIYSLAVSPDNKHIISYSDDHTIKLWDLTTGQLLRTFDRPADVEYTATVSPDNEYFIKIGHKKISIWNFATGQLLHTISYEGLLENPSISPNSKYLIAGSFDNKIKIWDLTTGQEILTFDTTDNNSNKPYNAHLGVVHSAAISANGKYIFGSSLETFRVWQQESIEDFCKRELTKDKKQRTATEDEQLVQPLAEPKVTEMPIVPGKKRKKLSTKNFLLAMMSQASKLPTVSAQFIKDEIALAHGARKDRLSILYRKITETGFISLAELREFSRLIIGLHSSITTEKQAFIERFVAAMHERLLEQGALNDKTIEELWKEAGGTIPLTSKNTKV